MSQNSTPFILSPGRLWISPVGEALPATSVAYGTAFGGNWKLLGNTKDAVVITYNFDMFEIETQQSMSPVARKRIKESLMVKTTLAEYTMQNLAYAYDGTFTQTVVATVSVNGVETFDFGGTNCLTERQLCVEALVGDDECQVQLPMRFFIWRATVDSAGDTSFGKDDYAGIPISFSALALQTKPIGQQLGKVQRVTPFTGD